MPQDGHAEVRLLELEALDHAVRRVRRHDQPCPDPIGRLVVTGVHVEPVAEHAAEPRTGLDGHRVAGEGARGALVQLAGTGAVTQVLDQRTAEHHVQQLHAPADGEHRQPGVDGGAQQIELGPVAVRHHPGRGGIRRLPVQGWIDVGSAGQQQPVQRLDQHRRALHGRDHHRKPSRRGDTAGVSRRHHHALHVAPVREARRHLVGADPDQRPVAVHTARSI